MPMYEYECTECGVIFERLEKLQDKGSALTEPCPSCGSTGFIISLMNAPRINTYGVYNAAKKMPNDFKNRMTQLKREHPDGFKNSQFF